MTNALCGGAPVEPTDDVPRPAGGIGRTVDRRWSDLELARLTATVESANDAIVGESLDGIITRWNPAAERLFGYSATEAIGRPSAILVPSDRPDEGASLLARVADGERIEAHPTRRLAKEGRALDVTLSATPVWDPDGRVVGATTIVRDQTETKRVEAALWGTEKRFRAFMDHLPAVAYMKDDAGRYVYVNRPFERVFRRSLAELQGKTDEEWLPHETARALRENDRAVLAGDAPLQVVETVPLLDGSPRIWLSVKFPVDDADGRRYLGGVSIDITERQLAEEQRERHARHAALRSEVSAALAERGTTGDLLWRCADAIREGLGAARVTIWLLDEAEEELELQASIGDAVPPPAGGERVPVGSFRVGRVAAERRPLLSNDLASDRRPGDRGWASQAGLVAFAGLPLLADDRLVGVVAVFAREPLAEETLDALAATADAIAQGAERKRAEAALAAERDLLQAVMDSLPDPVYVKDANSRFVRLNRATTELLGVAEPAEAIGKTDADFYPPSLAQRFLADERRVLEEGEPLLNQLEAQSEDEEGGTWLLTSKVPLRDADGAITGLVAAARDVTERHRLERERAAALAAQREYAGRLEELAALRADFGRMVAHELGSPIAAIRGQVDMLATGELPPVEAAGVLAAVRAEADVLQGLVADVREMASVERDGFAVRPRPVLLDDLLLGAAAVNRTLPGSHPLLTTIAAQGRVRADPERVGQVLRNLLGNAAKYTPPGSPIELRATPAGAGRVRVEVVDRGPGVHPDDAERIFEKFGRARERHGGHVPGVGLGLYLSRRIVEAHGGRLAVRPTPGGGATFGFELELVD